MRPLNYEQKYEPQRRSWKWFEYMMGGFLIAVIGIGLIFIFISVAFA